jgi:hypothetical protein
MVDDEHVERGSACKGGNGMRAACMPHDGADDSAGETVRCAATIAVYKWVLQCTSGCGDVRQGVKSTRLTSAGKVTNRN